MSWLSEKIKRAKRDGISVSKTWKNDEVNRIAKWIARLFTGGTLFACANCNGEWNVYGKVRRTSIGYVRRDRKHRYLSSLIECPYCGRGTVRPKGDG